MAKDSGQVYLASQAQTQEADIGRIVSNLVGEGQRQQKKIRELARNVEDQKERIRETSQLTTFGFIIALVTLGGVVIANVAYVYQSFHQSNQQTIILQQMKDEISRLPEKK